MYTPMQSLQEIRATGMNKDGKIVFENVDHGCGQWMAADPDDLVDPTELEGGNDDTVTFEDENGEAQIEADSDSVVDLAANA